MDWLVTDVTAAAMCGRTRGKYAKYTGVLSLTHMVFTNKISKEKLWGGMAGVFCNWLTFGSIPKGRDEWGLEPAEK